MDMPEEIQIGSYLRIQGEEETYTVIGILKGIEQLNVVMCWGNMGSKMSLILQVTKDQDSGTVQRYNSLQYYEYIGDMLSSMYYRFMELHLKGIILFIAIFLAICTLNFTMTTGDG
jgi:hypothetical protein